MALKTWFDFNELSTMTCGILRFRSNRSETRSSNSLGPRRSYEIPRAARVDTATGQRTWYPLYPWTIVHKLSLVACSCFSKIDLHDVCVEVFVLSPLDASVLGLSHYSVCIKASSSLVLSKFFRTASMWRYLLLEYLHVRFRCRIHIFVFGNVKMLFELI